MEKGSSQTREVQPLNYSKQFIAALNRSKHCSADVAVGIFRVSATVLAACQQKQLLMILEVERGSQLSNATGGWLLIKHLSMVNDQLESCGSSQKTLWLPHASCSFSGTSRSKSSDKRFFYQANLQEHLAAGENPIESWRSKVHLDDEMNQMNQMQQM